MGGDIFEGTQKLTNQQYLQITSQLVQILQPLCLRIQPYTPLPEKQFHGDVDFIVFLRHPFIHTDVLNLLQPKLYKTNNHQTINIVYKNKQVDFLFVASHQQFELAWFYKSYSGFGGYLGTFFDSKIIKLTHKGLYAPIFYYHLKEELPICNSVEKIMDFYGLDYYRHKKGYSTMKELYEFLRTARFLDQARYVEEVKQVKGTSKLMWGMVKYLNQTGLDKEKKPFILKDILKQTLQFFGKTQAYDQARLKFVIFRSKNQEMNKKFNARHILEHFDIPIKKQVDHIKVKFKTVMFREDEDKYLYYVETHSVEKILKDFGEVCGLKVKEKEKIRK